MVENYPCKEQYKILKLDYVFYVQLGGHNFDLSF